MTDVPVPVAVDLTDDERNFILQALDEWRSSASGKPFPFQVLGMSTWEQFGELIVRLEHAVAGAESLTDLDWARVLFLTEITFASSLIGAGLDFAIVTAFSDAEALGLLRRLQRKIGGAERAELLFPNGGRTRTVEEIAEVERFGVAVRQRQQGRQHPSGL